MLLQTLGALNMQGKQVPNSKVWLIEIHGKHPVHEIILSADAVNIMLKLIKGLAFFRQKLLSFTPQEVPGKNMILLMYNDIQDHAT